MTPSQRYSNKWNLQRAQLHFMLYGLMVAFCVGWSVWGWFALVLPIIVEMVQILTDSEYSIIDGLYDLAEGLLGGLLIGGLFFLQGVFL